MARDEVQPPPCQIESVGPGPPAASLVEGGSCCAKEPKDPRDHESADKETDPDFGGRGWHLCRGHPPAPLSFGAEARSPLARMVPGVDPLNDPAGQVSNLLSPEVNNDRDSSSLPTGLGQHFGTLWCLGRRWRTLPPVHRVWIRSPPPRRERGGGGLRLRELQEISPRVKPGGASVAQREWRRGERPPKSRKSIFDAKKNHRWVWMGRTITSVYEWCLNF